MKKFTLWSIVFLAAILCAQAKAQIPAYGIDNENTTLSSFNLNTPSSSTNLGMSGSPADDFENAGAVDPNDPNTAYVLSSEGSFFSVTLSSGTYTSLGTIAPPGAETWVGMEFDPTDGTLYAMSGEDGSSNLLTIDIENASATPIGSTGLDVAIALAIDGGGNMYTLDVSDDHLYSINKATGASTDIGSIGFDSNYGQGMCWDPNSQNIILSGFNDDLFQSQLRYVDTSTGESTLIGNLSTQIAWISINDIITDCPIPQDLSVNGTENTTADISWDAGDSEDNWTIQYAPAAQGFDPYNVGSSISVNGSTNATLEGLASATTYFAYIQADCSSSESSFSLPVKFDTSCEVASVPFTQDFQGVSPPILPTCGTLLNDGDGHNWQTSNITSNGFDSNVLMYSYDTDNDADVWYFTTGIGLTAGTTYQISFDYGNNSTTYTEKLRVSYGDNNTSAAMNNEIVNLDDISSAELDNSVNTFTVNSDGVYYFGFQAYSDANQFDLYVDNISITSTSSIESQELDHFTYYPNPVKNQLTLKAGNPINRVKLYNLPGQNVLDVQPNSLRATINTAGLPSGVYLMKVTSNGKQTTFKVVKN